MDLNAMATQNSGGTMRFALYWMARNDRMKEGETERRSVDSEITRTKE